MNRATSGLPAALAWLCVALAACAPSRGRGYEPAMAAGRRAYQAGRFDEAATHYDEARRRAAVPRDAVFAAYEAAVARVRAGDVAAGAGALRALADASPPTAYSGEAAFRLAELESEGAARARALEGVAQRFPDRGVARVAVVRLLRHDDEVAGPDGALEHANALCPQLREGAEMTCAYERAKRLMALGRHVEARDAFLEVARRWPYPFGSYFDDALFYASEMEEALGRPRDAVAHLERLLEHREVASFMGSYERPRYVPALLRIASLYETKLNDRPRARDALHRLYRDFTTSTLRDDALYREAESFRADGDTTMACNRLRLLARDFPDSKYVPCAVTRCPNLRRPSSSKAPATCRPYLERPRTQNEGADATE